MATGDLPAPLLPETNYPGSETAAPDADGRDMGTTGLAGRHTLEIALVRSLSHRSDARGLLRLALHLLVLVGTGSLIYASAGNWYLLIPAMILHGFPIVSMFAPMHECVHRTAFDSRWLNEVVGWFAGLLSFYNFTYYRYYHTWHHRYTQDPQRDPELMTPKPRTLWDYIVEISAVTFWWGRPWMFLKMILGKTQGWPFIPDNSRTKIALSAAAQVAVYVAAGVSIALGYPYALYYFFLPALLAQPILRAILIVEHTGCSETEDGLTNTRTTLAGHFVRLVMWNMPFHAEHHLYPSIPFHRLPETHQHIRQRLAHISAGYVAANREVVRALPGATGATKGVSS